MTRLCVSISCVLALALFCTVIDWILGHLSSPVGIFLLDKDQTANILSALSDTAAPFGLKISWAKTKVQNHGCRPPSKDVYMYRAVVGVEEFLYLGSKQTSDGHNCPDIVRHIGLASSAMSSLKKSGITGSWRYHQGSC